MNDSRREIQVGLMVIVALAAIVVMIFRFGEIGQSLKPGKSINIILSSASGVVPQTPVQLRGIAIGRVQQIELLPGANGVQLSVRIDPGYSFPADSTAVVSRSLLGDVMIDIEPGTQAGSVRRGDRIAGQSATDPAVLMASVEQRLTATLDTFERTGVKWGRLAGNLNQILESSGPEGVNTLQQTSLALQQFTQTMSAAEETLAAAGSLLKDPHYQQQLKNTMTALPQLLNETRTTLASVKMVVNRMDATVATVNSAVTPFANHSEPLVTDLVRSIHNVESMTRDLAVVSRAVNDENSSVKQLISDPSMYRNLDRAAVSLSLLLQNLQPVIADLQIFSDKIARHPELLGVRGVVRGSDGVKNEAVSPAGFQRSQ